MKKGVVCMHVELSPFTSHRVPVSYFIDSNLQNTGEQKKVCKFLQMMVTADTELFDTYYNMIYNVIYDDGMKLLKNTYLDNYNKSKGCFNKYIFVEEEEDIIRIMHIFDTLYYMLPKLRKIFIDYKRQKGAEK